MKTPEQLFIEVTGCDYNDRVALSILQESFKMKPHLVDKLGYESTYNFESAWEKSQADKLIATNDIEKLNIVEPPKA